jgi:hypothetical protein
MAQKQTITINTESGSWRVKPDGDVMRAVDFEGSTSIAIEKGFSMFRTDLPAEERVENQPGYFDPSQ